MNDFEITITLILILAFLLSPPMLRLRAKVVKINEARRIEELEYQLDMKRRDKLAQKMLEEIRTTGKSDIENPYKK